MRKVLSFVLVLALVLGSFSMAFAATPSDVAGTSHQEAVDVLMSLGVIDGYTDGTFKPDQAVTRAEMAKLIVVALGLEDYAIGTSTFTDMAGAGWAQGYVAYAASLGIVKGYPDGTFKPSQTVSYDEAAAMIVRALGYTDDSLTGIWPANYVVKAKALGILDGVKSAMGGANRGDIAEMLYNSLTLDIGYVNNDGDWTPNSELTLEELLAAYANEEELEGSPDNMLVRLDAEFNENAIIYGDEDSVINLRPYVGSYAATYTNDDDEIIAVVMDSTFLTGTYDGDGTFTANDVDYSLDDDVSDTDSIPYFYNGDHDGSWDLDGAYDYLADPDDDYGDYTVTIAVDLSGKKIKDVYTIADWWVEADDTFAESDANDIADDQELFGFSFVTNDDDEIDTNSFELVGVASLDDISEDDVVYVYADDSEDQYIRKVAVGTEVVSGEITKLTSGGAYTINGTKYEFTEEYGVTGTDDDNAAAGDEVDAALDAYGDIYTLDVTSGTAEDYAVVLELGNGTGSGLTGYDPAIKLFLADNTDETFDVDASAIDDANIIDEDTEVWSTTWEAIADEAQIIQYGVDEDGVVDSLDAVSSPTIIDGVQSNTDITAKGYYHGYEIADDAIIFTYAGGGIHDEDNYDVTTKEDVLDTDNVSAQIVVDDNQIVAMLIYDYSATEDTFGVITDWAENNSDAGYEFTVLIDGVEATYDATEDAYNTFIDDFSEDYEMLYSISFNASNEIDDLMFAGDAEDVTYEELSYPEVDRYTVTDGADYTLDSEVLVYTWNADDEVFEKGSKSDIDGAATVVLFDTVDTDEIYDIVTVIE